MAIPEPDKVWGGFLKQCDPPEVVIPPKELADLAKPVFLAQVVHKVNSRDNVGKKVLLLTADAMYLTDLNKNVSRSYKLQDILEVMIQQVFGQEGTSKLSNSKKAELSQLSFNVSGEKTALLINFVENHRNKPPPDGFSSAEYCVRLINDLRKSLVGGKDLLVNDHSATSPSLSFSAVKDIHRVDSYESPRKRLDNWRESASLPGPVLPSAQPPPPPSVPSMGVRQHSTFKPIKHDSRSTIGQTLKTEGTESDADIIGITQGGTEFGVVLPEGQQKQQESQQRRDGVRLQDTRQRIHAELQNAILSRDQEQKQQEKEKEKDAQLLRLKEENAQLSLRLKQREAELRKKSSEVELKESEVTSIRESLPTGGERDTRRSTGESMRSIPTYPDSQPKSVLKQKHHRSSHPPTTGSVYESHRAELRAHNTTPTPLHTAVASPSRTPMAVPPPPPPPPQQHQHQHQPDQSVIRHYLPPEKTLHLPVWNDQGEEVIGSPVRRDGNAFMASPEGRREVVAGGVKGGYSGGPQIGRDEMHRPGKMRGGMQVSARPAPTPTPHSIQRFHPAEQDSIEVYERLPVTPVVSSKPFGNRGGERRNFVHSPDLGGGDLAVMLGEGGGVQSPLHVVGGRGGHSPSGVPPNPADLRPPVVQQRYASLPAERPGVTYTHSHEETFPSPQLDEQRRWQVGGGSASPQHQIGDEWQRQVWQGGGEPFVMTYEQMQI